jgi:hypothetical protein
MAIANSCSRLLLHATIQKIYKSVECRLDMCSRPVETLTDDVILLLNLFIIAWPPFYWWHLLTVLPFTYFMAIRQWTMIHGIWSHLVPQAQLLATFAYRSTFYLFYGYASVGHETWHSGPIWSHMRLYWWHLRTVLLFIYFMAIRQWAMIHHIWTHLGQQAPLLVTFAYRSTFYLFLS